MVIRILLDMCEFLIYDTFEHILRNFGYLIFSFFLFLLEYIINILWS